MYVIPANFQNFCLNKSSIPFHRQKIKYPKCRKIDFSPPRNCVVTQLKSNYFVFDFLQVKRSIRIAIENMQFSSFKNVS